MQLSNLKTPCFILDSDKLVSNVLEFKRALNSRFSNHCIDTQLRRIHFLICCTCLMSWDAMLK